MNPGAGRHSICCVALASSIPDRDQQLEAALKDARRFLLSLDRAGRPDLSAGELRECLRRCREHLTAVVAASRPQAPLVRTVDEAAAALGISPMTIYRLVNDGDLPAYRISRRSIRIDDAAIRAFLAGRVVAPGGITGQDIPARHLPSQWP